MTSLQTVVMGLVIVFLDIPPDGYDWIADPVGWCLVLLGLAALENRVPNRRGLVVTAWACLAFSVVSWPAGSPATLTPVLGWLFSLPTLAWCFLISDAVSDAVEGRLRWVMLALRNAFLVVAPLPGLVYLADQDWLSTPAEVLILVANVTLIFALGSASGRPGLVDPEAEEPPGPSPSQPTTPRADGGAPGAGTPARPRAKPVGFSAAEAKRKARARREREARSSGASGARGDSAARPKTGATTPPSSGEPGTDTGAPGASGATPARTPSTTPARAAEDGPVTGAEVIEKVRRRRAAREKAQEQDRTPGE